MVFGFGSDKDDDDKKKKKEEEEDEEGKKGGRKHRPHRTGRKDDDDDDDEPGKGGRRPGRHRKDDDDDDDGHAGKPGRHRKDDDDPEGRKHDRPGRHGKHDEDDPESRPGRPGRHRKDDDDDDERPGRPGRHGRKDEDEPEGRKHDRPGRHGKDDDDPVRPGRPGRHGRHDDEEGDGRPDRPDRPGRHGRHDDDGDDPERPGRPGRHGRHDDDEGKPDRPGRHGRHDDEDDPARPGRPGRHDRPDAHGGHGRDDDDEKHGKHGRPHGQESSKPGRPGHHGKHDEPVGAAGLPGSHSQAGHGAQTHGGQAASHGQHGKPMHELGGEHHGHQQSHQQQHAPAHGGDPMHTDPNDPAAQRAKIEAQRRKDEEERIRLQKIADNQPGQPHQQHHQQQQQQHGGGGSGGGSVTVKAGESIQSALDHAQPGTTIHLEAGTYNESIKTRVDGTKQQPITIKGPSSGPTAIVKGSDKSGSCVEINHDYYILDDFTIDGLINEHCNKNNVRESFREKCLVIRGERAHREKTNDKGDKYVSAVDGITVKNMKIHNCGGEGVRLRYFVTNCTIFHNRITSTGCYDFKFGGDQGIKNGEGIYIGTSSKQWKDNPSGEPDICRYNRVYENYIDTHGNECVDVKEGTMDTIIEKNYCTGQLDEDSAGIDSRASHSIIRYNKVVGCKGAGVRLGGHKVGSDQYGIACKVYGNILKDNEFGGIKIMTEPHEICQNTISGKGGNYKALRGECAKSFDEKCECPFDVDPPRQDIETTDWFRNCKP